MKCYLDQTITLKPIGRKQVVMKNYDNELDTTIDEWRAEMDYMNKGDSGMTVRELAKEFGSIPVSTMRSRLEKMVAKKRCKKGIGKRIGAGGVYTVSVYRLIPENKESE